MRHQTPRAQNRAHWLAPVLRSHAVNKAANAVGKLAQQINPGYLPGLTREALAIHGQTPHPNGPLHKMLQELNLNIDDLPITTPKQWASLARAIRKTTKDFGKTFSPFHTNLLVAALVVKSDAQGQELLNWAKVVQAERSKRQYLFIESTLIPLIEKAGSWADLPSWLQAFDSLTPSAFWLIALKAAPTPNDLAELNNQLIKLEEEIEYAAGFFKKSEAVSHVLTLVESMAEAEEWQQAISESFSSLNYNHNTFCYILLHSSNLTEFRIKVAAQRERNQLAEKQAFAEMERRLQEKEEWQSVVKNSLPVFSFRDYLDLLNDRQYLVCYIRLEEIGPLVFQAHLARENSLFSLSYEVEGNPSTLSIELDFPIKSWHEAQKDKEIWHLISNLKKNIGFVQTTLPWLPSHDDSPLNPLGAHTVRLVFKLSGITPETAQTHIDLLNGSFDNPNPQKILEMINKLFTDY